MKMNSQEAGNYIADVINKNRQLGETNNQVLCRLFDELLTELKLTDPNQNQYSIDVLLQKFEVKNLYERKNKWKY